MCVFVKKNETSLTREKLILLISYLYGKGDNPTGLTKITSFTPPPVESDDNETKKKKEKQIYEEEKNQKNIFYYKLLCKIFDDNITIDNFKKLANQQVILVSLEQFNIIIELEKIFSEGIPEELRKDGNVIENIMEKKIGEHKTNLTKEKIIYLHMWFLEQNKPEGLRTIVEPNQKEKKEKFYRKLLYTIFDDLIDINYFNELAEQPITFP